MFPSETCTFLPKWHWYNCSQVRLAQLFPSETVTIFSKWVWYDYSEKTLTRLFLSDTGMILPKWHWHDCPQVDFDFLICILFCSLFFGMILPQWVLLGSNCAMYEGYGTWSFCSIILNVVFSIIYFVSTLFSLFLHAVFYAMWKVG